VFDRFWRADKARSRREGGTGLGLAIAQAIAKRHGGKITVTSEVDVGSTFQVRLPLSN
jgi:signal transduction histidine kinase